jgi:hypothetical protein
MASQKSASSTATQPGPVVPELKLPPKMAPMAKPEKPKKEKRERQVYPDLFVDEASAIAAAGSRVKGPRRAFKCTLGDRTFYAVHNNEGRAGGVAFRELGGQVEELGGRVKKAKVFGVDAILAALNALPESDRGAIAEALKKLTGGK